MGIVCALAGMAVATNPAYAARSCKPVAEPYPGTTWDGVNLRRIRATGVKCAYARRVVRQATYKAFNGLFEGPDDDGLYHLNWQGWAVTFDVTIPTSDPDQYVAVRRDQRVRWIF